MNLKYIREHGQKVKESLSKRPPMSSEAADEQYARLAGITLPKSDKEKPQK